MNKKLAKTLMVTAAVISVSVFPLMARDNGPDKGRMEMPAENSVRNGNQKNSEPPCRNMLMCASNQKVVMGNVISVDEKAGIVSVKNSDGKDVKIHVNPMTFIDVKTADFECEPKDGRDSKNGKPDEKKKIDLSEIKTGDWICSCIFNTDTSMLEAQNIIIVRK